MSNVDDPVGAGLLRLTDSPASDGDQDGERAWVQVVARRRRRRARRVSVGLAAACVMVVLGVVALAVSSGDDDAGDVVAVVGPRDTTSPVSDAPSSPAVTVEAAGLDGLEVSTSPLAADAAGWMVHTVSLRNPGTEAVYLDDFRTFQFLGDREILAATDGCGYAASPGEPVTGACTANYMPVTIEPGSYYEMTVTLWRDLTGMEPVASDRHEFVVNIDVAEDPFADPRVGGGTPATLTIVYTGLRGGDAGPPATGTTPVAPSSTPSSSGSPKFGSVPAPPSSGPAEAEWWTPDLDGDGVDDMVSLDGSTLRVFVLGGGAGPVPVVDAAGEALLVELNEQTTFTCGPDGLVLQSFDLGVDGNGTLRIQALVVDGSTGSWVPSPSFFFGSEFELPAVGSGCPAGR